MKKIKVSKKEIKEGWRNIVTISYCDAQTLLYYKTPVFYSAGCYGWNCDYYTIDNSTIISTGYSPVEGIRNHEIVKKYETKAEKVLYGNNKYKNKQKILDNLINKMIQELINE